MLPAVATNSRVAYHTSTHQQKDEPKKNEVHTTVGSPRDQLIKLAMEKGWMDAGGQVLFPSDGQINLDHEEMMGRVNVRETEGFFNWNLATFLQYIVPYFSSRMKRSTITIAQGTLSLVGQSFLSQFLNKNIDTQVIPQECWNFCRGRSNNVEIWISLNEECTAVQMESYQLLIKELIAVQAMENPPPDLLNALAKKNSPEVTQILKSLQFSSSDRSVVEIATSNCSRVRVMIIQAGIPSDSFLLDHFQLGVTHQKQKIAFSLIHPHPTQGVFDQLTHRLTPSGFNPSAEWALGRYWLHLTQQGAVFKSDQLEPLLQHAIHATALLNGINEGKLAGDALIAYYYNVSPINKTVFDLSQLPSETPIGKLLTKYRVATLLPILQWVGMGMIECASANRDAPVCQTVYGKLQIAWRTARPLYLVLQSEIQEALEKININDPVTLEALAEALVLFSPVPQHRFQRTIDPKELKILDALRSHSPKSASLFKILCQHVEKMDVLDLPDKLADAAQKGHLEKELATLGIMYEGTSFAKVFGEVKEQVENVPIANRDCESVRQAAVQPLLMSSDSQIASKAWSLSISKSTIFLETSLPVMKKEALSYAIGYVCQHCSPDAVALFAICLHRLLVQNPPFPFTATYEPRLRELLSPHLAHSALDKFPRVRAALLKSELQSHDHLSLDRLKVLEEFVKTNEEWSHFDALLVKALRHDQEHVHFDALCHTLIQRAITRNDVVTLREVSRWEKVKSLELLVYWTTRTKGISFEDVAFVHRLYGAVQPSVEQLPHLCDFFIRFYQSQEVTRIASDVVKSVPYFVLRGDTTILNLFVKVCKNNRCAAQFAPMIEALNCMDQDPRYLEGVFNAFPYLERPSETHCALVAQRAFELRNDTLLLQAIGMSERPPNRWVSACVMRHIEEKTPIKECRAALKAFQTTGAYQSVDRSFIIQLLKFLTESPGKSMEAVTFFCRVAFPTTEEVPQLLTAQYLDIVIQQLKRQFSELKSRQPIDEVVKVLKEQPRDSHLWASFASLFKMLVVSDQFLPLAVDVLGEFVQDDRCMGAECFQQIIPDLCRRLGQEDQRRLAITYAKALIYASPQQTKKIVAALPSIEWLYQLIDRDETYSLVVDLFIHQTNHKSKELKKAVSIATRLIGMDDSDATQRFVQFLSKLPTSSFDKEWIPHLKSLLLKNPKHHILFHHLIELNKPFAAALFVRCQKLHVDGKYDEVRDLFDTENLPALVARTIKLLKVPHVSESDIQFAFALFDYFNPTLYRSFLVNHSAEILEVLQGESRDAVTILFLKMGIATCRNASPDTILDTLRVLQHLNTRNLELMPAEQADLYYLFARSSDPVLHSSGTRWITGCICAIYLYGSLESEENLRLFQKYAESPFVPQDPNDHVTFANWIDKCYTIYKDKIGWKDAYRIVQAVSQFDSRHTSQRHPAACFLIAFRIWQSVVVGIQNAAPSEHSYPFTDATLQLINHVFLLPTLSSEKRIFLNELRDALRKQNKTFLHHDHEAQILIYLLTYVMSFDTPERTIFSLQDAYFCRNYLKTHADTNSQNAVSTLIASTPPILQRYKQNSSVVQLLHSNVEMLLDIPWVMDQSQIGLPHSFDLLACSVTGVDDTRGCHLPIISKLRGTPQLAIRLSNVMTDQQWARLNHNVPSDLAFTIFNELLMEGSKPQLPDSSYLFFMTAARMALHLNIDNPAVLETLSNIASSLPVQEWQGLDAERRILFLARWTAALCNISKLVDRAQLIRPHLTKKKTDLATDLIRLALGAMTNLEGCKKFSDLLIKLPKDPEIKRAILEAFIIPDGCQAEVTQRLKLLKQVLESQKPT